MEKENYSCSTGIQILKISSKQFAVIQLFIFSSKSDV